MATSQTTAAAVASVSQQLPAHLRKLFRAFVTPQNANDPERTFFVEALTHTAAAKKIAGAVSALEYSKLFEAEEAIYNVASAFELVHQGISDDLEARVFETGYSGRRVTHWVNAPVFLMRDPGPLTRAWARTVGGAQS